MATKCILVKLLPNIKKTLTEHWYWTHVYQLLRHVHQGKGKSKLIDDISNKPPYADINDFYASYVVIFSAAIGQQQMTLSDNR